MQALLRHYLGRLALRDRNYAYLFDKPESGEVVSIDCETTGLDPRRDDIISIAAVKIRANQILTSEAFRVTVKPKADLGANSIKIHQLRKSDVEASSPIRAVLPQFLEFIGNRPLVGYWIDFDIRMLNKDVRRMLGTPLPNVRIDVCDLFYDRKYGNAPPGTRVDLKFASILEALGLPPLQAHDAFNDAISTAQMYLVLKDLKERGVYLSRDRNWNQPMTPIG